MATLLILKRRIKTAQNVSKTTKAMQMIAASKLKKAQDAALNARPYVDKISSVATGVSKKLDIDEKIDYMKNISNRKETLLIIISPDKGLCGGLISNLGRQILSYSSENKNSAYITVGKKANGIVTGLGGDLQASFEFGTTLPQYDAVYPLMNLVDESYLGKKVSSVYILYTQFNSVFSQVPTLKKILPVEFDIQNRDSLDQTLFEPNAGDILPDLIRHYIEISIYQTLLESYLSEQSARMLAMQNATNNAKEIIEELKLAYNKSRQEKITNEILDITGGGLFLNG